MWGGIHELSEPIRRLLDGLTFLFAGLAAVSLQNAALVMTLAAAAVSFVCGGIRIYDRFKYGRSSGHE